MSEQEEEENVSMMAFVERAQADSQAINFPAATETGYWIAQSRVFGFDEQSVAIPWEDFRILPDVNGFFPHNAAMVGLAVVGLAAGSQISDDQSPCPGILDSQRRKVLAYWQTRVLRQGNN